jgi:O-antigen/teichoic acid export membrane protein
MAVLNIVVSFISIGLTLLLVVHFELGALGMVMAQLITSFIFFIQAQFYLKSDLGGELSIGYLKSSLRYGTGLLPHHLFAAFSPLLAKVLLAGTHSMTALGIYALALKLTLPLDVLYNSFNQGFQPVYFKTRKQIETGEVSKAELLGLFQKILLIAVGVYSALVLMSPWFIIQFIPERFHESIPLIPIIGIGFLGQMMYMLQVSDLFYSKRTFVVPLITGAGVVVNVAIAYLLVEQFGAIGIAWASSSGFVVWFLISGTLAKYKINIFNFSFLLLSSVVFIVFISNLYIGINLIHRICLVLVIIVLLIVMNKYSVNRDRIKYN